MNKTVGGVFRKLGIRAGQIVGEELGICTIRLEE